YSCCIKVLNVLDSSTGDPKMARATKRTYDALNYLPRNPLTPYPKETVITSAKTKPLYLVPSARVKFSRVPGDGRETTFRIVPTEGFFGECWLINAEAGERAVPLDHVRVMAWTRPEIEHQIEKDSSLGLALLEEFARAISDMNDRLQAIATRKTPERVMLSL